jgi:hypothetical protein
MRWKKTLGSVALLLGLMLVGLPAHAGINDRDSDIDLTVDNWIRFDQISAPSGNPANNDGWLYVKDDSGTTKLYFEGDGGQTSAIRPQTRPSRLRTTELLFSASQIPMRTCLRFRVSVPSVT